MTDNLFFAINVFDSLDMWRQTKSLVKKDFIDWYLDYYNYSSNRIIITLDDTAGLLRVGQELKKDGYQAYSFWINRDKNGKYDSSLYDYEVQSLNEFTSIIKDDFGGKLDDLLLIPDFDNTLCKSTFQRKNNVTENRFWYQDKWWMKSLAYVCAKATYLNNLFYRTPKPFPGETKEFFEFIETNFIRTLIVSYRPKRLIKKAIIKAIHSEA